MNKKVIMSIASAACLLAACGGTPEEQAVDVFEEAAQAESEFVKQQETLSDLEKKEQNIFQDMMAVSKEEESKIKELGEEADKKLKERAEVFAKEQEAMEKSASAIEELDELGNIEGERLNEQLGELRKTAGARYKEYGEIETLYTENIELNEKLFDMMEDKEAKLKDVEGQLEKINAGSEKLIQANEKFNQLTNQFNKQRAAFEEALSKS